MSVSSVGVDSRTRCATLTLHNRLVHQATFLKIVELKIVVHVIHYFTGILATGGAVARHHFRRHSAGAERSTAGTQ